ncbi:hypothetical protein [Acinetobacter nosocomialis]|uniref:hypothetical protein n=1 Tax=Acinetobacter nosocomialis TaxID=106654 RepID=UPI0029D488E7|nr:hypothetical protein [Acinetobacter nosocomialis]MDX7882114.1 hypothetical protein [Acinetobacter nosocomialis]
MAKSIRLRDRQAEQVEDLARKLSFEHNITIKESDIVHALVDKGLDDLTLEEIIITMQNVKKEKSGV